VLPGVRGDLWAAVALHLKHVEDCSAAEAREWYYDELGGEPCCQFLRSKERQEYNKHKNVRRSGGTGGKWVCKAQYQFLAIYEIILIKLVYGGMNTTDPHAATSTAATPPPRVVAGVDDDAGFGEEEEEEEEEGEEEEEPEEEEE